MGGEDKPATTSSRTMPCDRPNHADIQGRTANDDSRSFKMSLSSLNRLGHSWGLVFFLFPLIPDGFIAPVRIDQAFQQDVGPPQQLTVPFV